MAPRVDDRWLWLGFAVFSFFAAHATRRAITDIVNLTKIDPAQYEHDDSSTGNIKSSSEFPEDAINVSVLATLATSPNANISHAAISLIIARFWRDRRAIAGLDKDLNSRDAKLAARSHTALAFLRAWSSAPIANELDPNTGVPSELSVDLPLDSNGEPVLTSTADPSWMVTGNLGPSFAQGHEGFWTAGVERELPARDWWGGERGASPVMDWIEVPTRTGRADAQGEETHARRHVVVGLGERHRDAVVVERAGEAETS